MKSLAITRWNLGDPEIEKHLFEEGAVLELHGDQGNAVAVCTASSEEGGEAIAYFFGVSAAKWLEDEED